MSVYNWPICANQTALQDNDRCDSNNQKCEVIDPTQLVLYSNVSSWMLSMAAYCKIIAFCPTWQTPCAQQTSRTPSLGSNPVSFTTSTFTDKHVKKKILTPHHTTHQYLPIYQFGSDLITFYFLLLKVENIINNIEHRSNWIAAMGLNLLPSYFFIIIVYPRLFCYVRCQTSEVGRAHGRVGCACPYIMPPGVSFTPICLNAKWSGASAPSIVNMSFACL
jgi:hypothetical protein